MNKSISSKAKSKNSSKRSQTIKWAQTILTRTSSSHPSGHSRPIFLIFLLTCSRHLPRGFKQEKWSQVIKHKALTTNRSFPPPKTARLLCSYSTLQKTELWGWKLHTDSEAAKRNRSFASARKVSWELNKPSWRWDKLSVSHKFLASTLAFTSSTYK